MATAEQPASERSVLAYATYEDYLDEHVTADDLFYLGDQNAARRIVELGYKGKHLLGRDEFASMRAQALSAPQQRSESAEPLCSAGMTFDRATQPLLHALAQREELVRAGKLATVIFLRDYVHGQEVSAYMDYGHRLRSEDWTAYFTGARRLEPRRSDLSYYNWKTHALLHNSTATFQVIADQEGGLLLRHKRDRKTINVDPKAATPGDNSNRTVLHCKDYLQVTLYDHVTRRKT